MPAIVEHLESVVGELDVAADPDRPLGRAACSRRSCSTTASAPRAWRSTPRRPRASRVVPLSQIKATFPVLKNPANRHRAVGFTLRAVALRVHQHVQRGGVARAVRALPHPGVGRDLLGQRARQPPARPPGHLGRLQERRPRAAAVHLGQRGPPHAAVDPAVQRQALQVRHGHRGQGVRGPRTCCPRRRAGRRSPTTRWTGRCSHATQAAATAA